MADDGHLYYCKKPLSMKTIGSCTLAQMGSLNGYVSPQIGHNALTARDNGYSQQYIPLNHGNQQQQRNSQMPINASGVNMPPNVANRADYMSST
jgi:hypothetical protein